MKVLSNLVIAFFMASSIVSVASQANALQNLGGSGCNSRAKCKECQGDCDSDKDCAEGLKCFQRRKSELVPGCAAGGPGDKAKYDYCYKAQPSTCTATATTGYNLDGCDTTSGAISASACIVNCASGYTGTPVKNCEVGGIFAFSGCQAEQPVLTAQPTLNSTCSGGVCTSGKWAAYYGGKTESQCKAICDGYRVLIPEPDGIWEKVYDWGRQDGQFHNLQKHQKEAGMNRTVDQINYGSTGGHFSGFSQRDHFYVHWKGNIAIQKAGRYTFYTNSDDGSRLSINHDQVVSNPGWHGMRTKEGSVELAAGSINPFWAEMFEGGGGAGMIVYYKGPDTGDKKVVMPSEAFLPGKINELVYYFRQNGQFHDVLKVIPAKTPKKTRKVPTISYRGTGGFWDDWYKSMNKRDQFYVRWEGYIDIKAAGEYKFWTKSDDGSRLYVDGASMVQNPGWHGMRDKDGTRTLTAGKHAFWAEMFEGGGGAGMEVSYSGPDTGGNRIPLPEAALSSSLAGSGKLLLPENALNGLCGAFSHSPQGDCIIYTSCGSVSEAATSVCEDNSFDWVGLNGRMEGLKTCTYESKTSGGEPVPEPEPGSTGGTGEPSQLF